MAKTAHFKEIVSSRVFIVLISYLMIITTLHCSICIPIFTFNFNVKPKSNKVMFLARFLLQGEGTHSLSDYPTTLLAIIFFMGNYIYVLPNLKI